MKPLLIIAVILAGCAHYEHRAISLHDIDVNMDTAATNFPAGYNTGLHAGVTYIKDGKCQIWVRVKKIGDEIVIPTRVLGHELKECLCRQYDGIACPHTGKDLIGQLTW